MDRSTGDPNGEGLPRWPTVSADTAQTMRLGDGFGPIPIASTPRRQGFFEKFARQRRAPAAPAPSRPQAR